MIVIPNAHVENLYEIDEELLGAVYRDRASAIAGALKEAYDCSGTSTRQHNEPDGNQDVWHLHVHVFPRYAGDGLYERHARDPLGDARQSGRRTPRRSARVVLQRR